MCMEAVEMMTHHIMNQSAVVCDSKGSVESSVMQGAKMDMMQILDSKRASRTAFVQVKSGADQLITEIFGFCKAAHRDLTNEERAQDIKLLESAFQRWHEHASKTAEGIAVISDDLMDRTQQRMQMLLAGGGAVIENISVYEQAAQGLKQAAEKCKMIQDLADPKVQMALKARKDALGAEISATDRDIVELRKEKDHNSKVREEKDNVIASQVQFMLEQNEKKKEWRDWHIRRSWADRWEPEMQVYDRSAEESIGYAERQRDRAEKDKVELERFVEAEWEASLRSRRGLRSFTLLRKCYAWPCATLVWPILRGSSGHHDTTARAILAVLCSVKDERCCSEDESWA